ncbi:hypothetical protein HYS54_04900 [Candidatus Micrarchaeota archaeon]|nr:hypothetical protein [Candidatus Micrarchaeota archaeon]
MVSLTLAVPKELKEKMDKHQDVNWSEVARRAICEKLSDQEKIAYIKKFAAEINMTEDDAIQLGREANKRIAKRHFEAAGIKYPTAQPRKLNRPLPLSVP